MPTAALSSSERAPNAWWREPYLWLVVGGPLAVVVAGVLTVVIAVKNPDPVLDPRNSVQAQYMAQSKEAQAAKAASANLQPAMLGRNHAASPLALEPTSTK